MPCDDRSISSFCELSNSNMRSPYFSDSNLDFIADNLEEIVTSGEVYVKWDGDYNQDVIASLCNTDDPVEIQKYIDKHFKYILKDF